MKVGIIGFGQLGQFMACHLIRAGMEVAATDIADKSCKADELGVEFASLEKTAKADVVVIATPINQFGKTLEKIKCFLKNGALVMDVCSVKVMPAELMRKTAEERKDVEFVACHPLFGPQSGANGIKGLKIVICPIRTTKLEQIKRFLEQKLELKVIVATPEEHDRQMATAACLSHFIGRALINLGINEQEIDEPSFRKVLELKKMLQEDSFELFMDIQQNNPFARDARDKFVNACGELNAQLNSESRREKNGK